ncbi:UDP-2,4-diacetamido-2,4,6-trideoxy-beta-L-altropyranose hydrolase [Thalassolituus sp. LLYu03]|uniref:UDP-2,4-diacetamido-2,4, 6-trideoxy-beta-L-altropyranose hydrolase n=1 Tax=Thalassolituus sp. LLYu03 TaxID=3421656 RepID=UPI003D2806CC
MKVAFRCDASTKIGTGHVMRCLTLAGELKQRGHECRFLCREQPGHLIKLIQELGYMVDVLPVSLIVGSASGHLTHADWLGCSQQQDAEQCRGYLEAFVPDWMVVDHYALDAEWERALEHSARYSLVIDDLADRAHCSDVLLDQNAGRRIDDYKQWVSAGCQLLIGPEFALLRPEFRQWRAESLNYRKNSELRRLMISFGGVDKDNFTGRTLAVLSELSFSTQLEVTVVIGHSSPWRQQAEKAIAGFRGVGKVVSGISNMAELLSSTDFVIGACGSSAWERCCLGVPSLVFVSADNQQIIAHGLSERKAALTADCANIETVVTETLTEIYRNPHDLLAISQAASTVCSGSGAGLVADQMEIMRHG